ncbi:MAG: LysE family translocator [Gammaproteobacteria bacterium]|jgi:threonine/homoserine/homoserine lactone efflux protein
MDFISTSSFFLIMLALAAMPSASVALVVTRSATLGVQNGIAVSVGIVVGDLVFIALALSGMSVLAETLGVFFTLIKYIGGAYLIWLGFSLLRSKPAIDNLVESNINSSSLLASALSGFVLTLGDLKAILFYASLFPSLLNVPSLTVTDLLAIVAVTVLAVGGVKILYAFSARKLLEKIRNTAASRHAQTVAGSCLMGTGTYLIVKV